MKHSNSPPLIQYSNPSPPSSTLINIKTHNGRTYSNTHHPNTQNSMVETPTRESEAQASPSSSLSPFPAFSATDVTLSPLLTPTTQLTPTSNGTNAQAMTRKPVPQSPGNREVSQTSQEAKPNVDTHNPKNENQEEDWELTSSSSSRTNNVDDMPNERVPQIEISIPVLAPEPEPERVPGAGSELDPQRKSSAKSSAKTSTRESV
ncbi:hypothetical protein ONS96_013245 [Cadophora gregata f. sp. sojae]|nr:hypothetical protein ONS96_013245 [Cadophora gregata f. sp. sojae]